MKVIFSLQIANEVKIKHLLSVVRWLELLKLEDFSIKSFRNLNENLQEEEKSKSLGVELRPLYYQIEIWTKLQEILKNVRRCFDIDLKIVLKCCSHFSFFIYSCVVKSK